MSDSLAYRPTKPSFDVKVDQALHRVTVAGELDIATVPLMVNAVRKVLTTGREVTIDLRKVKFADARSLGALIELHNSAAAGLLLSNVPACVERLLLITGLDAVFRLAGVDRRSSTSPRLRSTATRPGTTIVRST